MESVTSLIKNGICSRLAIASNSGIFNIRVKNPLFCIIRTRKLLILLMEGGSRKKSFSVSGTMESLSKEGNQHPTTQWIRNSQLALIREFDVADEVELQDLLPDGHRIVPFSHDDDVVVVLTILTPDTRAHEVLSTQCFDQRLPQR